MYGKCEQLLEDYRRTVLQAQGEVESALVVFFQSLLPDPASSGGAFGLGLFYLWWGCLPDAESAFYFAGVTYTTIGYGELVLVKPWRMLAPIEGLTGILMCGLSTGFFFAVVNYIHQSLHTRTSGDSTTDRTQP